MAGRLHKQTGPHCCPHRYCSAKTAHHPSASAHHPSTSVHNLSTTAHHPSTSAHKPSTTAHHPSASARHGSTKTHHRSTLLPTCRSHMLRPITLLVTSLVLLVTSASSQPTGDGTLRDRLDFGQSEKRLEPSNKGVPPFLQSIYSRASHDGTIETPYPGVNEIKAFPDRTGPAHKYTFSFVITEIHPHEEIKAVELRFYSSFGSWPLPWETVYIYRVTHSESVIGQFYSVELLTRATISLASNEQHVINLPANLVQSGLEKQKIQIIFTTQLIPGDQIVDPAHYTDKRLHADLVRNADDTPWEEKTVLVVYVLDHYNVPPATQSVNANVPTVESSLIESSENSGVRRRKRRSAGYNRNRCRLVPFVANFTEIGWTKEFVIGPETYEMNLCMGECPFPSDQKYNATNHAIMQGTFNAYNTRAFREMKVPKPCCVPDKLEPITLLYMEPSHNVVLKLFRDMKAAHCGCY